MRISPSFYLSEPRLARADIVAAIGVPCPAAPPPFCFASQTLSQGKTTLSWLCSKEAGLVVSRSLALCPLSSHFLAHLAAVCLKAAAAPRHEITSVSICVEPAIIVIPKLLLLLLIFRISRFRFSLSVPTILANFLFSCVLTIHFITGCNSLWTTGTFI